MSTPKSRPFFTLRTNEVVGRGKEIKKIQKVLEDLRDDPTQTHLFYIAGDGGVGKTRLLEWVQENYGNTLDTSKTFCTRILDFYNSALRNDLDLVEQIDRYIEIALDQISDQALLDGLSLYRKRRDVFRRQQAGAAVGESGKFVIQAFINAWRSLVDAGYRLIVLLDTAEWLRFIDDEIRKNFDAPEPIASAGRWLIETTKDDKKLPGVLFVVAGRKQGVRELYRELRARSARGARHPEDRIIDLGGFDQAGSDEYFRELASTLRHQGFSEEANMFDSDNQAELEVTGELRNALFRLTNGFPISLAISLQLLFDGASTELFNLVNEQMGAPDQSIGDAQQRLQDALVDTLANQVAFRDLNYAIRYMSLARKGLTPARMQKLLMKLGHWESLDSINGLFDNLKQQIFIKQLPDGSLVLHDKLAEWAEYLHDNQSAHKIYTALTEIYDREVEQLDRQISALLRQADPIVSMPEDVFDLYLNSVSSQTIRDPQSHNPEQGEEERRRIIASAQLQVLRRARRNRHIDQMSYRLRCDPLRGYEQYFDLAEEAFNVGRMDYEAQIRSELVQWWEEATARKEYKYRSKAADAGISEQIFIADMALRSVQRTFSMDPKSLPPVPGEDGKDHSPARRATATETLVDKLLQKADDPNDRFNMPPYMQILLNVYKDMAQGQNAQSEQTIASVRSDFEEHINELGVEEQSFGEDNPRNNIEHFLILNALAFAHYEFGFFEANHGNHNEAIKQFTKSLLPYRELRMEINQARSLNDKGYSLAIVGNSIAAEIAVKDALDLRKQLGFSFPIALSYNTLGIVHTMSGRPADAIIDCTKAFRLFHSLDHIFGQMIALRALSEAYRLDAERLADDQIEYRKRLESASNASNAALALAEHQLTDEILKVDILIEHSSAHRDLARYYWQRGKSLQHSRELRHEGQGEAITDEVDSKEATRKAIEHRDISSDSLNKAIDVSRSREGSRYLLVDALINRAYLNFYESDGINADLALVFAKCEQMIQEAIETIPLTYRKPGSAEHDSIAGDPSVYWALLCKGHALGVRIQQKQLEQLGKDVDIDTRTPIEEEALRQAVLVLYFSSLLDANLYNARISHQIVYNLLRSWGTRRLGDIGNKSLKITEELKIPTAKQNLMPQFLRNNFRI